MPACRVLLTGFEPFGGWPGNPSAALAVHLGRNKALRAAGLRTAILPVHRLQAPAVLSRLLDDLCPDRVLMTGLAAGRTAMSVERLAVNLWRQPGFRGVGRPIDRKGADAYFTTIPLEPAVRALGAGGAPVEISESAGSFACNLVTYRALQWAKARSLPHGEPPWQAGFIHLPATSGSLPAGRCEPCLPEEAMLLALQALCESLLET